MVDILFRVRVRVVFRNFNKPVHDNGILCAPNAAVCTSLGELTQREPQARAWAFFTPGGQRLRGGELSRAMASCGAVFCFEGGSWVFPGVRVGHNVTLQSDDPRFSNATLTTLSLQPLVPRIVSTVIIDTLR